MPDIDATLSQLTLEEKVSLLAGKNFWETVDIPEKGVPSVKVQKRAFVVQ
jgi:beta-glucosidase